MNWPANVQGAVERLVVPSAADLLEARAVILDLLSEGTTRHEDDMVNAMAGKRGISQAPAHDEQVDLTSDSGQWPSPTGDELHW